MLALVERSMVVSSRTSLNGLLERVQERISTTLWEPSPAKRAHYALFNATFERLSNEGIEQTVSVCWKPKRLWWAMGFNIIAPLEVRNESDLAELASLAKRLIKGQTDLKTEFPEYSYAREDWLRERALQSGKNGSGA